MAKILVVEDEKDIRELLAFTLRFAGHDVLIGSDGEEALALARQEKPDLVLLDVRMPRLDGYAACRQMKAAPELAQVPVVFLSAKGQEAEVAAGFEAGAAGYLLKPFSPAELARDVEKYLIVD